MTNQSFDIQSFSKALYQKLQHINPAIGEMELYEFRYALHNLVPEQGWDTVSLEPAEAIEQRVNSRAFYDSIQIKPRVGDTIVLDEKIIHLTRMLLVGLASGVYSMDWVKQHFFFDIRGFYFLHRTIYFSEAVLAHLGGKPYRQFEPKQRRFEMLQDLGYKAFKDANAEVDQLFIECVKKIICKKRDSDPFSHCRANCGWEDGNCGTTARSI